MVGGRSKTSKRSVLGRLRDFDVRKLRRPTLKELQDGGWRTLNALARTPLPAILFATTYIISHFLPNADFSYPYELVLPIILLALLISLFFYLFRAIFKRVLTAQIATLPLAYFLYHYGKMSNIGNTVFGPILPNSFETPFTLSIVYMLGFATFFGALAWGIVRLFSRWQKLAIDLTLTKIALFVITFNFLVQAVVVCNFWYQARHQLSYDYKAPAFTQKAAGTDTKKPNIYYLLFDRYTDAKTLQNIYGYDNSAMLQFLESEQFVTRESAYANYPYTMASVGSTLAMGYEQELAQFADDKKHTGFPYRAVLNSPPIITELRKNGYEYNLLSSWWDFARIGVRADREPTKSFKLNILWHDFYLSDFSRDIVNRSVLKPLVDKGIGAGPLELVQYELDRNPQQNFLSQIAAIKQTAGEKRDKPQFTFAHMLMPHDPYVFMPDGSDTTYSGDRNDEGADENVKYVNQLRYTNEQIKDIIQTIKAKDPEALIVMQSDEGPYPKQFRGTLTKDYYFDPKNLPTESMQQKMGIMASYYFPGVDKAEVAANMTSNVNTYRYVLSKYLGYDLPPLPDCHLSMGNKFNLYNYTVLNKQLTGKAAPACEQYTKP